MKSCATHAVESSKIHNGFDAAGSRFQTRQPSLSHTCLIGFKSSNKLSRGRLAMFCWFLYTSMMWVQLGLAMSSPSTMFLSSSESKGDRTPDSRITSWSFWEFKVSVTTFNYIMWSSDNAPHTIMLQLQFVAIKNQCRPFPFSNTATLFIFFQRSAYNTLRHVSTLSMPSCFIPAFLMAILHILSSFLICRFIQHTRLRLFHDSAAKEIYSCISNPGQHCVVSFPFMDSSEWN